jgi:hypothetical protein
MNLNVSRTTGEGRLLKGQFNPVPGAVAYGSNVVGLSSLADEVLASKAPGRRAQTEWERVIGNDRREPSAA